MCAELAWLVFVTRHLWPRYPQTHSMNTGNGSGNEANHDNIINSCAHLSLVISFKSHYHFVSLREILPLRFTAGTVNYAKEVNSLTTIKC